MYTRIQENYEKVSALDFCGFTLLTDSLSETLCQSIQRLDRDSMECRINPRPAHYPIGLELQTTEHKKKILIYFRAIFYWSWWPLLVQALTWSALTYG